MSNRNSILIADDDAATLTQLTHILTPQYRVYAAKNGALALQLAEKNMPDLILLDVVMPDMDGFEVLARLKASETAGAIPVIFITGMREGKNERMGLDLGAVDYIRKPVNEDIVTRRVGNQIELVNMRRELEAMVQTAQEASRAKSRFLANMSHEIRTPMNVIMGLTEILLDEDTPADQARDYLKKIRTAGTVLTGLINDVLDISKIESGKLAVSPVQYELAGLLSDIVTINMMRIENKPVTFELDLGDDAGGDLFFSLFGDDLRVKQVFNNLLSNAFKYTRAGTVTLGVRCAREGENDVRLSLWVRDTGIGIRPEDMGKLFGEYNQVDTQANRHIEGTGLGLSIVKGLIELMGGTITVESEYGKGTTFRASLVQGFVADRRLDAPTIEALRRFRYADNRETGPGRIVRPDLSWAKVLVVDDSPTNLDVARGFLGKYHMQVDCLSSGQEAVDRIRQGHPLYSAVFMDHMMPGMDGVEAVGHIRALGTPYAQNLPIIALTANAVAGSREMFLESGFQDFVSKPVSAATLDGAVRQWVVGNALSAPPEDAAPSGETAPPGETAPSEEVPIDIPGINARLGLSLYEGDRDMLIAIMRSFAANIPEEVDKLRTVSEQSLAGYGIDAHTLKGASASIGAKSLANRAKAMEKMAKSGDLAGVLAQNDQFVQEADTLIADLNTWLAQNG